MFLGMLTLITALCISAVAIYYSVAGLVAIFAAAALPIMIMGGVLEVGKLVTAVWLHKYWKQATWWLKSYLSVAVIVLMFITSMGIFGFLSKAHIEQTSASEESIARVETIQNEIDRQLGIVGRAENRIRQLEGSETGADANVQSQIDREQERIESAYERIQPAIQEQNAIIANVTQLFQSELDKIDADLAKLQNFIDTDEIAKAQAMVGAKADGSFGPKTAEAFTAWQDAKKLERGNWIQKIQDAAKSPTVIAAREEIARLRANAEKQIADSNTLINRLRNQLGDTATQETVQKDIDEQNERVRTASSEIETLTEERIALESEYRKLEAEVGPIKYIAEFIYGESADNNMLEEAVRWVIIIIIFVFDPLAVLLLIAAQYTFDFRKKELEDENGERLRLEREEYERARAQAIVDNPGVTFDDPVPTGDVDTTTDVGTPEEKVDEDREEATREEQQDAEELRIGQDQESVQAEDGHDSDVAETAQEQGPVDSKKKDQSGSVIQDTLLDKEMISDELKEARTKELEVQDQDEEWQTAKQAWKDAHPTLTLKSYKGLYVDGKIDELPWEQYKTKNFIAKDGNVQVKKETTEDNTGYIQNEEQQNEESIWKKIQKNAPE